MIKRLLLILSVFCAVSAMAQNADLVNDEWKCSISSEGYLENIIFEGNDTIPFFRTASNRGPSFYLVSDSEEKSVPWIPAGDHTYISVIDGVRCQLKYLGWNGMPSMEIILTNESDTVFQPEKAGLKLGIDTYMDVYPDWYGKFFPTLMRNEKTHFHGYMQSPLGKMIGIVSPDPVASWSVSYNLGYPDPPPFWFMGHRIESLNLDLLNALPLPDRNPQHLWKLDIGQQIKWTVAFMEIPEPGKYEECIHRAAGIPMLRFERTSYQPGETAVFEVLSEADDITVVNDNGECLDLNISAGDDGFNVECLLPSAGLYKVKVCDGGKVAEGMLTAHASWQWIMERAREGALKYHQKPTSHVESWYGFHSAFLAARYFPEDEIDTHLRNRFDYIFDVLHDTDRMEPRYYESRIQNTASTIGMLVDKYQAFGEEEDLVKASRLADWLIETWQREDGAYVNHNIVYTSVIYIAKSILELTLAERELAAGSHFWRDAAQRHYDSAKRAVDQLVASQGDFETEGEMTFEDGMVSCSALQVGMLALMQEDPSEKERYRNAMLDILDSHDCLAQLRVPDARRRGGTMRYWEAQYDVQMLPNMFNSPHGWSGWRAYATYYAYLLTGEERWLVETYNAMGAFANVIDYKSGKLRWAFVVDPYVKVKQACSADVRYTADSLSFGNPHPQLYETRDFIIGEQYVDMISDWQTVNTQDNDVHELFKCIAETVLTNAFVLEREDGSIVGFNCNVRRSGRKLYVTANEKQIINLHCNFKKSYKVYFNDLRKKLPPDFLGWTFGKDI